MWAATAPRLPRLRDPRRHGVYSAGTWTARAPKGGPGGKRRDGYDLRIVSEAELGPGTFAAYEDTSVAIREHKTYSNLGRGVSPGQTHGSWSVISSLHCHLSGTRYETITNEDTPMTNYTKHSDSIYLYRRRHPGLSSRAPSKVR